MTEAVASLIQLRLSPNFPNNSFFEPFPEIHMPIGQMSLISEFTIESLKLCNLLPAIYIIITLSLENHNQK